MDPNAALISLLSSLEEKDVDSALESLESLSVWLGNKGFCPIVESLGSIFPSEVLWVVGNQDE